MKQGEDSESAATKRKDMAATSDRRVMKGKVFALLLRLGCSEWQILEGKKRIREILATDRVQLPCESNLPPIPP
jgi:hypothetical protein